MTPLHVTNGASAAAVLRAAGMTGDIVTWDDVLHEGPVPGGLAPDALRAVRAGFIADVWGPAYADALAALAARDAALAGAAEADEVLLWFEHDLYDQLQLCQVLDRLCCAWPRAKRVGLVCGAEYVGRMEEARVRALFAARRPITAAQTATARLLWGAFTAPDPAILGAALATDTSALPFAAAAFRRLLQEYPWTRDGLSRTERQMLAALAGGPVEARQAFPRSHHAVEDPVFLGDVTWARIVERLSRAAHPLVTLADGAPAVVPRHEAGWGAYWRTTLALTAAGHAVLAAEADHVTLNGADRWIGGVHLTTAAHWRWNDEAGRTEAVPPA